MIVGRGIFAIGCESMYVSQSVYIYVWMYQFEFRLAGGMSVIPNIWYFVTGPVMIYFYGVDGMGLSFLITLGCCVFSFLTALAMVCLDIKTEKNDKAWLEKYILI